MKKKFVASGLAAGLIAGAGAGLILQSTGFAGASSTRAVSISTSVGDDTEATDTGRPDRSQRFAEALQPLVDSSVITADQMTAVIDALEAARPEGGRGGRGDHGDHGDRGGRGGRGQGLEAAATALGTTSDELRTQLRAGSTLAEVASEQGVPVQTVIDAMVAEVAAHLDGEVAEGDLTQAEADTRLADMTTRITDLVNNGRPDKGEAPAPTTTTAP